MRVGATRYRWEFRLKPDETADDFCDIARLHPLITPWTTNIPVEQLEIVRVAEYAFRAQIADRWRDRRIFLLGDAAHLTPPFIGQGMGAGVRDAANLSWKLAGVVQGRLPHRVLDTYEVERKPHARALIRTAKLVGTAMTAGGRLGDVPRRIIAPHLHRVPGLQQHILDGQTPPLRRSDLVVRPRLRRTPAGKLCPNPVLDDRHFDDVVAGRLALVTTIRPTTRQRAQIERFGAVLVAAPVGTALHAWLRYGRAHAAIVRPDGAVLRAGRDLAALCAALSRIETPPGSPGRAAGLPARTVPAPDRRRGAKGLRRSGRPERGAAEHLDDRGVVVPAPSGAAADR